MLKQNATARSRRTAPLLALVLGLHGLVLLALAQLGVWRDRGPPIIEGPPLQVWLLNARKPPPAPPRALDTLPQPALRPNEARRPRAAPGEPQAITLPAPATAADPEPATAVAPSATAAAAASAPPALNLALPRGASAPWRRSNPAMDDLSARSARATFEGRFARENGGSGEWVEERLGTDRIQFRRGGICVEMERSRAGQLDRFNQSAMPKPWGVKQPREC